MNSHGCQLSPYAWHEFVQTFLDHAWTRIIILAIVVFSATVRGLRAKSYRTIAAVTYPKVHRYLIRLSSFALSPMRVFAQD